jgi:PilZ domain
MAVFKRESRKPRHQTLLEVWLTLDGGFAKRRCTILDLSVTGARLKIANADKLGSRIALALTNDVRKLTPCRMVWQKRDQIGVEFVAAA